MITGQTVKNTYQGDGVNREFTITFEFTDSSQVKFKVNGQEVTTNFSLNTVAKTLTYPTVASELDPLTSADTIEIYRDTEITQDIEFNNGGPLNAKMIEDGLDKLTMISQELKDKVTEKTDVTELPEGTDIDGILDTGVYFVKNPTSTLGMPIAPNLGGPKTGSYVLIKVTSIDNPPNATYLSFQEMTLVWQNIGMDSWDKPKRYSRYLTDRQYSSTSWTKLDNTIIELDLRSEEYEAEVSSYTHKDCYVVVNASGYGTRLPATAIIKLTIQNYFEGKMQIVFKAGYNFELEVYKDWWLGEKPVSFTQDSIYLITVENGWLKCEEVVTE